MKKRRRKYIDYDLDESFISDISLADEAMIEKLLKIGKIKTIYATKTITSGKQIEVEIYPEFTKRQLENNKTIKKKTRLSQKNLNDKNARKHLTRLLNTNFDNSSYWITYTYDNDHLPKTIEEAQKNMRNCIRRINRLLKKKKLNNAKYIYITEFSKEKKIRCHHHVVIDCDLSMNELEEIWNCGRRNNIRRIHDDEEGLTGLANYLTKDPRGKKRWNASKNLKKPTIRKNHQDFSLKKIRQMIENKNRIREFIENKYPGLIYLSEESKYNAFNGRTYFYIRLSKPVKGP